MRSGSWFGWLALALILVAVALSGCFPIPLGCQSTWFRRCNRVPAAPAAAGPLHVDEAKPRMPDPEIPGREILE